MRVVIEYISIFIFRKYSIFCKVFASFKLFKIFTLIQYENTPGKHLLQHNKRKLSQKHFLWNAFSKIIINTKLSLLTIVCDRFGSTLFCFCIAFLVLGFPSMIYLQPSVKLFSASRQQFNICFRSKKEERSKKKIRGMIYEMLFCIDWYINFQIRLQRYGVIIARN